MKRGGPLRRKMPIKRTGFKSRRNKERSAKMFEKNFGRLAAYVRTLECFVCKELGETQATPTQAAHVRSRGAGNHAWLDNGDGNILPMCHHHHDLQTREGWTAIFEGKRLEARDKAMLRAKAVGESFRVTEDPLS